MPREQYLNDVRKIGNSQFLPWSGIEPKTDKILHGSSKQLSYLITLNVISIYYQTHLSDGKKIVKKN